jgi:hypothetical protein
VAAGLGPVAGACSTRPITSENSYGSFIYPGRGDTAMWTGAVRAVDCRAALARAFERVFAGRQISAALGRRAVQANGRDTICLAYMNSVCSDGREWRGICS